MITETVQKQIPEAMKARDEIRLSTLKLLSSFLHNAKIDKRGDLTEEEEIAVVKKEAKKRKDAIEIYEKVGEKERVEREKKELAILETYLPQEMSDDELEKIVDATTEELGAKTMADMGRLMGAVMGKVKGKADGTRVSSFVKEKLSG